MSRHLILTFHGLGEPPDAITESERNVWVALEWFEAIIEVLPRSGVGLAFDDGNASDVQRALPALVRRGLTARFFPLTGRIGAEGYLAAADIATLKAAGMGIGSHGCHHRDWRAAGDRELGEELTDSRRILEQIVKGDIAEAACPFGSYDRRVLQALRAAGYRRIFNSDGGAGSSNSWLSPRTTVDQSRPLEHWLDLAKTGPSEWSSPVRVGKRLAKRLR